MLDPVEPLTVGRDVVASQRDAGKPEGAVVELEERARAADARGEPAVKSTTIIQRLPAGSRGPTKNSSRPVGCQAKSSRLYERIGRPSKDGLRSFETKAAIDVRNQVLAELGSGPRSLTAGRSPR